MRGKLSSITALISTCTPQKAILFHPDGSVRWSSEFSWAARTLSCARCRKSEAGYTAPQYARANGHNGMANFLQNVSSVHCLSFLSGLANANEPKLTHGLCFHLLQYNVATRPRFSRSPAKAASAIFKGTASASSPGSGSQGTPPIPSRSGDRASSEPVPLRKELGPPPEIESSTRRISFEVGPLQRLFVFVLKVKGAWGSMCCRLLCSHLCLRLH